MKYKEITQKDDQALRDLVATQREVLRTARFDTTGANQSKVQGAKQIIARALTALSARAQENANKSS